MAEKVSLADRFRVATHLLEWVLIAIPIGIAVGTACALFLWMLDEATTLRFAYPWLYLLLPLGGALVGGMYYLWGGRAEGGNNLILDEINQPGGGVPLRMAPLVLIGTVLTHLFGGSAGREGTAVQMGGALAHGLVAWLPWLSRYDIRIVLMAGIAAGFGGVFGTPVAGAVFALEVLVIGRMNYLAIFPCLVASIVADQTTIRWGAHHTHYHIASILPESSGLHVAPLETGLWCWVVLAGALFGLTSLLFAKTTHQVSAVAKRWLPHPVLRPMVGGCLLIGMVWLVGTRDYLGLGVRGEFEDSVTIVSCFTVGGAFAFSWLIKLLFTAVTLGTGFKGGEVTPLFFIGAALGNTLAVWWGLPVDLMAALGFVGVFAGATNTPIACTLMAVELFGGEYITYFATVCFMAYLFSGPSGIYASQKLGIPKHPGQLIREESAQPESASPVDSTRETQTDSSRSFLL